GKVRPRPVNLFAAGTAAELVVIDFGKRLEFVDYIGLGCLFQRCVTSYTARKRRDQSQKVKTADNLNRLFVRVLGVRGLSVFNDRVHAEPPISGYERAIFTGHDLEQLPVIRILAVDDIKSEETKIACECSQMPISDKPRNVNSLQSFLRAIRVTILDREDLYLCVPGQRVIKTDC